MHTMTLPQEIVADKEKAKILETRIYQLGKTTKLWKPKIKNEDYSVWHIKPAPLIRNKTCCE
jgi:hypothetical protein